MEPPVLHDPARDLWVVPIRHHSPACAAHLERLIAAVQPRAMLVEGPCDFDPLIEQICDPRTRAPVAIVALREGEGGSKTRRAASYFPFCAHSPELIALQAARAQGITVRFIDLPSSAREWGDEEQSRDGRSLMGSERGFDVGDYVTALARELGCRDGNEAWDHLFETRLAEEDWRRFFTDVAHYCACIRAATDADEMERDGTLAREAQMRAIVSDVRRSVDGPILVLVGGFHAEAVLAGSIGKPLVAKAGAGRSYLIRYGMRQLDALRGYGAGLPLPGYYDRIWQARGRDGADLAVEIITGFAAHLRNDRGEAPSFPLITNAIEQAHRLAALRGRAFPLRDDVLDAVRTCFIKDEIPLEQVPMLNELRAWLTGTAMGDVPPDSGSPPLVEAVRAQARSLGFSVADGERRSRELDIYRKPRHRDASRFCHAMTFIGTSFAERTAGPDFRNDAALDRLHEVWSLCWSPMVEARLIELCEGADSLDEALAFTLAERLALLTEQGKGRSALAAIDLFATACRAGLGERAQAILQLIEEQVIEDPEVASLIDALTDLLLLRRGHEMLVDDAAPIDRLIVTCWRRLMLLLPELGDCGAEQVQGVVAALAGLRGTVELARSADAPIDFDLLDTAFDTLAERPIPSMLAGAVVAFALLDGRADVPALEARLKGELAGGYVDPAERLAFLGGVIAIARELVWSVPAIIAGLEEIVAGLDEAEFIALLPYLRLALMPLDPREVDRLAEQVAARLGVGAGDLAASYAITEGELSENLRLDQQLAALLVQDGVA